MGEAKYQKFSRMMEVDTTSEDNTPNATLHLPQIMKSFLPGASRKAPAKTTTSMHSSWIDLTSRKKIKQVAPNSYKLRPVSGVVSSSFMRVNLTNRVCLTATIHSTSLVFCWQIFCQMGRWAATIV